MRVQYDAAGAQRGRFKRLHQRPLQVGDRLPHARVVGGVDGEDVVAKPFGSPLKGLHRRAPYGRLYPT